MKRVIKGNIILYIVLLAVVIMAMILLKTHIINHKPAERDYQEISNDTLRFVTNIYHDDLIEGITLVNFEVAELIGEESGLAYKIDTINSLTESIRLLNNNKYDVIARPIFATTANKEELLFSKAIDRNENSLVVVQRKDGGIKNNLDLVQKSVSIIDDESIKMIINNIAYESGDSIKIDVRHNCSAEQLIAMVADSTIEYAVCGYMIAKRMKEFLPQLNIDTKISIPIPQAWGVRHSSPTLKDSLDVWLERVRGGEEYKKLMNKYGF